MAKPLSIVSSPFTEMGIKGVRPALRQARVNTHLTKKGVKEGVLPPLMKNHPLPLGKGKGMKGIGLIR